MPHPSHLQCRSGWYYFRLRIPSDLTHHFPCNEIRKSLKTQDLFLARFLIKMYLADIGKIFTLIRSGMLNREQIQHIVRTDCLAQLAYFEQQREAGDRTFAASVRLPKIEADKENARIALAEMDFQSFSDQIQEVMSKHDVTLDSDTDEYRVFTREYLKMYRDMLDIEIERCNGNYNNDHDKHLKPSLATIAKEEISPKNSHHSPHQNSSPPSPKGILLSEAIDMMLKEKGHHLYVKTLAEYTSYRNFVINLVGDRDIAAYTRQDMLQAREDLKVFPKKARQDPELKKLDVKEILKMNIEGPKLKERTYQKYLNFLTTVFNYCIDETKVLSANPCPKWKKSKKLKFDKGWEAFDQDELNRFFKTSYFVKPAVRLREPEKFWIPPIAYTTGMREDEICQLYKNDVRKVDGIWCFDINTKEDKKVKNEPSIRIIPIPPELIELGFLDYVRSVKHKRLWPNLIRGQNGYSHNYSKMIGKHIRRHVTKDGKKVFHSFRDSFAEEMLASKVQPDLFGGILGHAPSQAVTAQYAGKYPVDLMLEAMQQVKHRIDIVALLSQGNEAKKKPHQKSPDAKVIQLRAQKS